MKFPSLIVAAPLVLLAACGGSGSNEDSPTPDANAAPAAQAPAETPGEASPAPASAPASVAAASSAPAAFQICKTCHSVKAGENRVGPSLHGIVGSTAGDVEGYAFSPALKKSGIVWTPEKLDEWLQGPMKMVPGTKMVQMIPDAAKRQEIITYLETLK